MSKLKQLLKEVISSQYFAVLNSVGEGLPYSNLVSFAISDDFKFIFFVTDRKTRKYRNIQKNHNISLLIDNRTNQPSDITRAMAITVIGTAKEEIDHKSNFREIFLKRHPQLTQFIDDPNNALIMVSVGEYIIAGFDKTRHIAISQ